MTTLDYCTRSADEYRTGVKALKQELEKAQTNVREIQERLLRTEGAMFAFENAVKQLQLDAKE